LIPNSSCLDYINFSPSPQLINVCRIVTKPEEYTYSSANQYYTGKASLIPVEVIV